MSRQIIKYPLGTVPHHAKTSLTGFLVDCGVRLEMYHHRLPDNVSVVNQCHVRNWADREIP